MKLGTIEQITLQDFVKYELEDINYKKIIFCFDIFENKIHNDILTHLKSIYVNHLYRWDKVLKNGLFTVKNCDLEVVNLYSELKNDSDYKIVLINRGIDE